VNVPAYVGNMYCFFWTKAPGIALHLDAAAEREPFRLCYGSLCSPLELSAVDRLARHHSMRTEPHRPLSWEATLLAPTRRMVGRRRRGAAPETEKGLQHEETVRPRAWADTNAYRGLLGAG